MDLAKIRKKAKAKRKEEKPESGKEEGLKKEKTSSAQKAQVEKPSSEQPQKMEEPRIRLLCFYLGKEVFALKMKDIKEIIRIYRVTPIPRTPPYLQGVLTLRGKIIPVLDMKQRLGVSKAEEEDLQSGHYGNKIIIANGSKGPIGFYTERLIGVMDVLESELKKGPTHIREEQARYIEAVAIQKGRFITILKAQEALSLEIKAKETGGIKGNGNT